MESNPKYFTNKKIHLKLDEANYLMWKQIIRFTIVNHRLEGYLDGSICVDDFITNAERTKNVNPSYSTFKK